MSYDQDQRRKIYALDFTPYPGLTVTMRKPGFAALDTLTRAVLVLGTDFEGRGLSATDQMAGWRDLFDALADGLVGWNLTDGGRAVPATREGVLAQDLPFLLALARTWHTMVVMAPEGAQEFGRGIAEAEDRERPPVDPTPDGALNEHDTAWLESFQTTTVVPGVDEAELLEAVEQDIVNDLDSPHVAPAPDGAHT